MDGKDYIARDAIALAEKWQNRANGIVTREERAIQEQMMRLLRDPVNKVVLTKMIDQSFRADDPARVANQVNFVLRRFGVPKFFSPIEQMLMRVFLAVGRHFPSISVPKMVEKMREDSARAVVPGEDEVLYPHLRKRKREGVRMNINHIGEVVQGEEEAQKRLDSYLKDLRDPEIEYISVKISTIYSQISGLAFENTVAELMDRLSRLYRAAAENTFTHEDGRSVPKFVNLDMEEYRDLEITAQAFIRTLDLPEFRNHAAGIVLQAYLPDSFGMQQYLTEWAKKRVADGGAPIKIRIVKGANMEMELVESSLNNWPLAPYDNKRDVDANYKRMVDYGMQPENMRAVHLGIASHNLFELAYAFKMAQFHGVTEYFSFEMLEGMADHIRRAIQEISGDILLYAPVATKDQFINAIAYLIRRLDENTGEENFLRYSFNLTTDSKEWRFLKDQFLEAYRHRNDAPDGTYRIQDRDTETFPEKMGPFYTNQFVNEPDTDWSLTANRKWAEGIRDKWMRSADDDPLRVPVVVAGKEIFDGREQREFIDPGRYSEKIVTARYALGTPEDAETAVATAKADPDGWRSMSFKERNEILARAAMELRKARGDLIGAAAANTGKVYTEADPEVSEAVDFTEFYSWTTDIYTGMENVRCEGKGVGLVISPWNFPIAIPTGGMAASLAAGNTVIFKPASAAAATAYEVCQCFWRAGVSKNTLQFLPCSGSKVGGKLTNHPDVDYIILTGGTDTGMKILQERPGVYLAAETGGKNATVVTAMSDRDQAIKNVLHSAFSNTGQKCSATSLLILEKEVYEDAHFRKALVDAAESLCVGSPWRFRNKVGPLIAPPDGDLLRGLTTLEPGESWVLKPENLEDNPYIWSPGIKWGVQPGSYTHMTEFFGPVLGVMRADDLDHAIELVNMTGFGLTSGIESLDRREQEKWKASIKAGNLYVNRGTTGAIVLRQPFGGMGKSALGAGIKAGSPNYVTQFMTFEETGLPPIGAIRNDHRLLRVAHEWRQKLDWNQHRDVADDLRKTVRAIESYLYHYEQEFSKEKDYFKLRGQDNVFRYRPIGTVVVRVHEADTLFDVLARIAAVKVTGCTLLVSIPPSLENPVVEFFFGEEGKRFVPNMPVSRQSDASLVRMIPKVQRIRYAAPDRVPAAVFEAASETGFYIARTKVMMEGRLELIHYFQEQAVSNSYHRYGNLGERALNE
mgnify:CR=1 FL=1